jgi:hypothetical protein
MDRRKLSATGTLVNGRVVLFKPVAFREDLARWPNGPIVLSVERTGATRSLRQNAYYWSAVIGAIVERTGFSPIETHELCKAQHLSKARAAAGENGHLINGLVIGGSTVRQDTLEFCEYLERIIQWAAETIDVVIEPPDPTWRRRAEAARRRAQAPSCPRPHRV